MPCSTHRPDSGEFIWRTKCGGKRIAEYLACPEEDPPTPEATETTASVYRTRVDTWRVSHRVDDEWRVTVGELAGTC
jgi:hypothetical protein